MTPRASLPALMFTGLILMGSAQQKPAEIQVRVVDEQTGFTIPMNAVNTNLEVTRAAGRISISSESAGRTLSVAASGYAEQSVTLPKSGVQVIEVRLEPNAPPPEFSAEAIRILEAQGTIVVAGFVGDEATGAPLPGVRVRLGISDTTRETNDRGFFSLSVAAPSSYSPDEGVYTSVRFEKLGYRTLERTNARLVAGSVRKYRVRLVRGSGRVRIDERASRSGRSEPEGAPSSETVKAPVADPAGDTAPSLPTHIRVGLECKTSTSCTRVIITALEDYVRHVLPNEWIASWHPQSLKAGAIAARSVGAWFTKHPKSADYDACNTTMCQVYDPDVTQSTTDTAVDATRLQVLVKNGTLTIEKAEFSAENNDSGCGDGKTGTKATSPCIEDIVCAGEKKFGHGRGMCQSGSNRWAKGKTAKNAAVEGGPRTSDWILTHYYPNLVVKTGVQQ